MLTAEGCRKRQQRVWDALGDGCEILVFGHPESIQWLCGFELPAFEFRSTEAGAILYLTPERSILVGDRTLAGAMGRAFVDERTEPVWYDNRHTAPNRSGFLLSTALEALDSIPGDRLGVELTGVSAGWLGGLLAKRPDAAITTIGDTIRQLRRVKEADELALVRQALRASDAAARAARTGAGVGVSEQAVYQLMLEAALRELSEPVRLYGDFVSNPVGDRRGGPATDRKIGQGELLLLDYSVVVHGYRGDVATTFLAGGGMPSDALRRHFDACVAAHEAGAAMLRPGVPAREVARAVRRAFEVAGVSEFFTSQTGHGIGLGHPEPPYLVEESDDVLQAGEVVTIEPSQFVPGVCGMRLEHDYWIGPEGTERLSNHVFEL